MKQLKKNTHGHVQCYGNGCRCELCVAANNQRIAGMRKRRTQATKDPTDPRHGKRSFYVNHGCRCEPCTEAHRKACAEEATARGERTNLPYRKTNTRNTSGRVGVSYCKNTRKWRARIKVKGKITTAYRETFEEAVAAREAMEELMRNIGMEE